MTPTVPVTVTLASQDGVPYQGVTVRARLDVNEVYQGFVISDVAEAVTDATGVAILNCFPNAPDPTGLGTQGSTYSFRATIPGGRALNVEARVPNAACRLENILVNDTAVALDAATLAVLQAQAAAAATGTDRTAVATDRAAIENHIYPGTYAVAPATRPNGAAIQGGDVYFDTAGNAYTYASATGTWVSINGTAGSFIQSGAGAVPRTYQDKLRDFVSVKDFGAKGDGVTDDTAAINAALASSAMHVHFPAGNHVIVDPLQDGTPVLVSNLAGRLITCDGTITANTTVLRAMGIYGAGSVVQVNIAGNGKIAEGVRVYADRCIVEDCRIEDLYTTTYSSVAIGTVHVNGGIIVRNNFIRNLTSVGDATGGNGNGQARAVLLSGNADATAESVIENNYIQDVLGEEGDCITVISSNGAGTYYAGAVTIRGNTIRNFTRRAVKIQASRCRIRDNFITHDFASSASVPNAQNVIDLVQGGDHHVIDNILQACKWFAQISCQAGSAAEAVNNIFIERNRIFGLGSETTQSAAIITTYGGNVTFRGNFVQHGAGRGVSVGQNTGQVIEGNIFLSADNAAESVIAVASGSNSIVRGNVMLSGTRQCFVRADADNVVISDNHVKCNTPFVMDAAGGGNLLVINNSIDGTSNLITDTDTNTGNRFGSNYAFGNQASAYPGPLCTPTGSGPTVSLAGKYVQAGQIVYDTTPTAGSFIGWVAMTSGLAEAVTWKQFGAIQP